MKANHFGNHLHGRDHFNGRLWTSFAAIAAWLALGAQAYAGWFSSDPPLASAPEFGVFETSFKSSTVITNPLEDVTLKVAFTSPAGEVSVVRGFWDGGKTWKVRFSPDLLGKWKFHTTCSDPVDFGLNDISGEFLCMATVGQSSFAVHGPVRVARDHRHLEFADHTPFFWVADTVWDGAVESKPADWAYYAQARSVQGFNVAQWVAAPEHDAEKMAAYNGTDPLQINLEFFKKMDAKVAELNRAGILNAIVAHGEISLQGTNIFPALPEPQTISLLRYMVARWGANDVVWVLTCDGTDLGRCRHILHSVFGDITHAPVIMYPGDAYWVLDRFRKEPLVDVFGYQSGQDTADDSLAWLLFGPVAKDWKRDPTRPWINLAPAFENEPAGPDQLRNSAAAVRRAAYWSVLHTPANGVSYGGHDVWDWNTNIETSAGEAGYQTIALWQKALFMPAAKKMGVLADFFNSIDFWRLHPAPELIANQPGLQAPGRFVAAAITDNKDLAVVYVPEDREVELNVKALSATSTAYWIDPATGARAPVTISFDSQTCKLSTPNAGDWLLLIQAGGK